MQIAVFILLVLFTKAALCDRIPCSDLAQEECKRSIGQCFWCAAKRGCMVARNFLYCTGVGVGGNNGNNDNDKQIFSEQSGQSEQPGEKLTAGDITLKMTIMFAAFFILVVISQAIIVTFTVFCCRRNRAEHEQLEQGNANDLFMDSI